MKQLINLATKSYYSCLLCPDFRTMCGGMPTRGLTLKEWCERIRDTMDYFGLSAAYVAKEANVSQRTVEKIHAGNIDQDIMRSTCISIEIVVFGKATNLLCNRDYNAGKTAEKIAYLEAQIEHLLKENHRYAKIIDKYLD